MSRRLRSFRSIAPSAFPRGHIGGMSVTTTATTTTTSVGECRTGTSANRSIRDAVLTAALVKTTAEWVAGDGNGGLANGVALADNTWYHEFILTAGGSVEKGYDTSVEAVNLLADADVIAAGFGATTSYRRIRSHLTGTGGGSPIRDTIQHGDLIVWSAPSGINTLTATDFTGADTLLTLTGVPPGVRTEAILNFAVRNMSNRALLRSGGATIGAAPETSVSPLANALQTDIAGVFYRLLTNTAQQVVYRVAIDASSDFILEVESYVDARGRWD
jgi:hypothetical protein